MPQGHNEPARAQDVPAAIARAYYLAMQPPCGPTLVTESRPPTEQSDEGKPWPVMGYDLIAILAINASIARPQSRLNW
jgi:benzoylformate decarboxylase